MPGKVVCPMVLTMVLALSGCGEADPSGAAGSDADPAGTGGAEASGPETVGFVFSQLGFHQPENRELGIRGFDLDGHASLETSPTGDECAHDDFSSPDGETGIDYAWLKLTDMVSQLAPGQFVDSIAQGAVTNGEMTVLIEVSGVDDMRNDDDVQVQVFSSLDTPPTGPDGILPNATLSAHPDDDFNSDPVSGRIVDGVLTVGPIDIVMDFNIQVVDLQLTIQRAWMRMDFNEDRMTGVFAGFWPVAEIFTSIVDPTTGLDGSRMAAGFTRDEFNNAIVHADGDFNGEVCESISIMFDFEAVHAFVLK